MIWVKKIIYVWFVIIATNVYGQNQPKERKDTIFYLLDTAKIPVNDRIIDIIPYPKSASFYTYMLRTHCMVDKSDPNLMSVRNDSGEILSKSVVEKMPFISLVTLNDLLCKEMGRFKFNHQLYFVEHLPNGKYLKRKIILGAIEYGTNDHSLIEPSKKN